MLTVFKHCAFEGCIKDLKNTRGGAFCEEHETEYGNKCRIRECPRERVENTLACHPHQAEWRKYKLDHSCASLLGVKIMLQRPEENNDGQPGDTECNNTLLKMRNFSILHTKPNSTI
jgi:hypothetical protein